MRIFTCLGALALLVSVLPAQPPTRPVFDVASIKPSVPEEKGGWTRFLPGGRFEVHNAQLSFVIQRIHGVKDYQIVDAAQWITNWDTARFEIEAKAEGVSDAGQLRLMARNLLEDRFQLKLHRATRDMPVYVLTLGKKPLLAQTLPEDRKPRGKGYIEPVRPGLARGQDVTVAQLVSFLARYLDRPLLDGTNYTEPFTFQLEWAEDGAPADDPRPGLLTALGDQLGLKLVRRNSPVDVLVIDGVERPSAN